MEKEKIRKIIKIILIILLILVIIAAITLIIIGFLPNNGNLVEDVCSGDSCTVGG